MYTRTLAGRWIIPRSASSTIRKAVIHAGADAQPFTSEAFGKDATDLHRVNIPYRW